MGLLSFARRIAPEAISMFCSPCVVTGLVVKWKVTLDAPASVKLSAAMPLTRRSPASMLEARYGSEKVTTKSVGGVATLDEAAGVLPITARSSETTAASGSPNRLVS